MKTHTLRENESELIRVPGLGRAIRISVERGAIVIRAATTPRKGWKESLEKMAARGEDKLLDDPIPPSRWDEEEWEWK